MHLKFEGGSELQRRWFLEAARSLEGVEAWKERWVHSEFRDYLVTIEGYPIFEHPVMVEVDWTGDPAPSLHNEWAYTENALLTMEQICDVQPADAALNPISGMGDFPSFGDAVIPISTIRIKSDLHTKGEELYKYVVRHELGHVIMHSLEPNAIWNLAISFGLNPGSAEAAAEWFQGEGLTWAQKGKESIAETVADAFWLGPTRGPGRWNTNRTRYRLQSEDKLRDFVSELAPSLGGFSHNPGGGHPSNPYSQSADPPPVSSTRGTPYYPGAGMQVTFHWGGIGSGDWEDQMYPEMGGGPDPTVVWRQHFISGGERLTTTPEPIDESVDEVTSYWSDRGASIEVPVEIHECPGGICTFEVGFTTDDLTTEFPVNQILHIFETLQFDGTGLGAPPYIPGTVNGTGSLGFTIEDGAGRPCWLPYIERIGDELLAGELMPLARQYQMVHGGESGPNDTIIGDGGVIAVGSSPIDMGFWLHDSRIPVEPVLAGTSLAPESLGDPIYNFRPDASSLELPIRLSIFVAESGSFGSGLGDPIPAPKPYFTITKRTAHNHDAPPAWEPPWPYKGEIHAEPAPPGSKLNKPVMGAPGPQVVVQVGAEPT